MENLRFIRRTMERDPTFTAVPGWGGAGMGLIGLLAAVVASRQPDEGRWILVWLGAAPIAMGLGGVAMHRKAARAGLSLVSVSVRKFAIGFLTPAIAGAVLTFALAREGVFALIPGTWLLLYGVAVAAAGGYSVRPVPLMGAGFMVLGILSFLAPPAGKDLFLGAGFGGLHLIFGVHLARNHGG